MFNIIHGSFEIDTFFHIIDFSFFLFRWDPFYSCGSRRRLRQQNDANMLLQVLFFSAYLHNNKPKMVLQTL